MKILQINTCNYRRGGADVVYLNTCQLLRERGHDVINFSKFSKFNIDVQNDNYFVKDIDYFHLSPIKEILYIPRFLYSIEAKEKLDIFIRIAKPDVAHIHLYKGILTSSILQSLKLHKIPVVITLHDYELLCPRSLFIDGKGKICEKCLISNNSINCVINKCNRNNMLLSILTAFEFSFHKRLFPFHKYFDKLITVSKFGKRIHSRRPELKNLLVHLYNFYPKLEFNLPNYVKGDYFLSFGRLSPEKGILTLIKAWEKMKSHKLLKIAGEGPIQNDIRTYIEENKLSNIEMLGFQQGAVLHELIRNASFIIVPSECYENNPLSIVEAYSNGKPVIATRIGGITEIVIENKTGFTFELGNIEQLVNILVKSSKISEEEYSTLSKNARHFSDMHFSEEEHYSKLIEIYNSVLK